MRSDFEDKFEKAIKFLKNSEISSPNKPVIPHALRVGKILYEKGFDDEVVTAGLLHDLLEWSETAEKEIEEKFGKRVLELIKANSKDRSIKDSHERRKDIVARCRKIGDDALAIKIADTLDSFQYYTGIKKEKELERCREIMSLLKENLSDKLKEVFSNELKVIF